MLKKILQKLLAIDTERDLILRFAQQFSQKTDHILDVGCGYGRLLKPLTDSGYYAEGVEKNNEIVAYNRSHGLVCHAYDDFNQSDKKYQTIVLSHIIEHFAPTELVKFLDYYLDRLETGGHLVIATPAVSDYFYDDFDHIKPYLPTGLLMVYGNQQAQVQYYSQYRLKLKDLLFRISPFSLRRYKSLYVQTKYTKLLLGINAILGGLYYLSGKRFGSKDGWIGVFEKIEKKSNE